MSHVARALLVAAVVALASAAAADEPQPLFLATFDEGLSGCLVPKSAAVAPEAPSAAGLVPVGALFRRVPGRVGQAVQLGSVPLAYDLRGMLLEKAGTVMCWIKPDWDVTHDPETYEKLFVLPKFGMVYRFPRQAYWTFALHYHHIDEKHDYGCKADCRDMRRGEWRHVAAAWSVDAGVRKLYIDGKEAASHAISRPPGKLTALNLGPFHGAVDELCVFDRALGGEDVRRIWARSNEGRSAYPGIAIPSTAKLDTIPSTTQRPPDWVQWDLDGAERHENRFRSDIVLNGVWRCRPTEANETPPDPSAWQYRKVPAEGPGFPLRDAKGKSLSPEVKGWTWHERAFRIPPDWTGRRIEIDFERLAGGGSVFLNGKRVADVPALNAGVTIDATKLIRRDAENVLAIRSEGIIGDVWLRSRPASDRILDAWLVPSFRERKLEARAEVTGRGQGLRTIVRERPDGPVVKEIAMPVPGPAEQARRVSAAVSWGDPHLWSPEDPFLYVFETELLAGDGQVIDRTLPREFGFREFRIEGDSFLLNGRPVSLWGHSHPHFRKAAEYGDPDYIEYSMTRWQETGVNFLYLWYTHKLPDYAHIMPVADRLGMMLAVFSLPRLSRFPEEVLRNEAFLASYRDTLTRWIRRYRQHPSLVLWLHGGGAHVFDFCPSKLDGTFDPEKTYKWRDWSCFRQSRDVIDGADGTRPVFPHSCGNFGPVHTSMAYMGFGVDLRERANWPLAWSKVRHKPVLISEFGLPVSLNWTTRPPAFRRFHGEGKQYLGTEYAAMYFGEQAYGWEPDDVVAKLSGPRPLLRSSVVGGRLRALFAERSLRAWRTYGISYCFHAEVPGFFEGDRPTLPAADRDPRRAGATPDAGFLRWSFQASDDLSELGRAVKKVQRPLLIYLGGPDGRFTLEDHAFYSGEALRKAMVVVNDRPDPADVKASWQLTQADSGAILAQGNLAPLTVKSGHRSITDRQISVQLPDVQTRTDMRLCLTAQADGKGVQESTLAVTVFPKAQRPAEPAKGQIVWLDPAGESRKRLDPWQGRKLGDAEDLCEVAARGPALLVLGRRALADTKHADRLRKARFDEAVNGGLRVLVLEQAVEEWDGQLMGLRLRETSTRRAFIRAPGHPVLCGLAPSDFTYWRGDSDLMAPYPDPGPAPKDKYAYPVRFWRWGNDNVVATVVIEQPQSGAARALLDCGFDLCETPLLEVCRGKGRMIFCQLDVTSRYGDEPVATRLADNLMVYLLSAPAPSESVADPADLARQALGDRPSTLPLVRSRVPDSPEFWGISDAAVFFRRRIELPVFDKESAFPLFTVREIDGRRVGLCSLSAAKLSAPWLQAKTKRIEAALRIDAGGTSSVGPSLSVREQVLYPIDWAHVGSMKKPFDPYAYWRW